MAGTEQPRLKVLHLLQLLKEETDEEHGVPMTRILGYLENHGISAERKAIYRDIATLQDFGYEIEKNHKRPVEYCLINRSFDIAELKLLVDAVQSAHFIPEDLTDTLIRKLESLTSKSRAVELRRQVHYSGRIKTENDHVYYTTGTLHDAINHNKRVTFTYIEHTIEKGTKARREGQCYEISPYALVWNDDKYYVVGYYERYTKVCNFRVDRMKSVTCTKVHNLPKPEDFEIDSYIKNEFGMYTGETVSCVHPFCQSPHQPHNGPLRHIHPRSPRRTRTHHRPHSGGCKPRLLFMAFPVRKQCANSKARTHCCGVQEDGE